MTDIAYLVYQLCLFIWGVYVARRAVQYSQGEITDVLLVLLTLLGALFAVIWMNIVPIVASFFLPPEPLVVPSAFVYL